MKLKCGGETNTEEKIADENAVTENQKRIANL